MAGRRAREVLSVGLETWALACPLPLVLFFDEVDALRGKSLLSFLAQVRDGFAARPYAFPKSVALCGLRDVRDYRAASGRLSKRRGPAPASFSVKEWPGRSSIARNGGTRDTSMPLERDP